MRHLLAFLLLVAQASASGFIIIATRSDGGVLRQNWSPAADVPALSMGPTGTTTWYAIPMAQWSAQAQDLGDGVPVYVVTLGKVAARPAAAVTAERRAAVAAQAAATAASAPVTVAQMKAALASQPALVSALNSAVTSATAQPTPAAVPSQ